MNPVPERKVTGSMLIVEDESVEAVRKLIEADCYWTENIVSKLFKVTYPTL